MRARTSYYPGYQKGAALAVSLMILLVLTIIGISGMRSTSLEEKMAGNLRDREIAFEAAESTLRYAEDWVDINVVALGAFDDNGNDGLYNYEVPNRWAQLGWTGADSRDYPDVDPKASGRFIVEHLQTVANSDDVANLGNYGQGVGGADLEMFRITARGTGGGAGAEVLLQTTFSKAL